MSGCHTRLIFNGDISLHHGTRLCEYHLGDIWHSNMTKIVRLQKRGIRSIMGLCQMESCREAFKELGVLTAPSLYAYKCLMSVHDSCGEVTIPRNGDVHSYNTRQRGEVRLERHRTLRGERVLPHHQGLRFLRVLPPSLQAKIGGVGFGAALKDYLINEPAYTVGELLNR